MRGLHAIDSEPVSAELVDKLEDLLRRAKAGELSSIAVAVVYRNGNVGDMWTEVPNISLQLGSIERMKHRLLCRVAS